MGGDDGAYGKYLVLNFCEFNTAPNNKTYTFETVPFDTVTIKLCKSNA